MTGNPEFRKKAQPEKRFSLASDNFNVNFQADESYAFFVLTHSTYPERVVFKLVPEIRNDFDAHRSAAKNEQEEEGLSSVMRAALSKLCRKYDDPANVDKLLKAQKNVAKTTSTLTDTIDSMTQLSENTEIAVETTVNLQRETSGFQREANDLHENLVCHRKKLTFIIIGIVAAIVVTIVVIVIIAVVVNSANSGSNTRRLLRG